ncbi:radical SAM/SPASM domain-containing protein [Paenibacillus sp.]|jgi:uncharacterized protein|uniref:radical SAM/SPASM domain-containing protein n=1 Tax=Paenibacillus sp. TaxID=58172 RepID=UPI00281D4E99|nr:radical SAM protein [Paenibacillus sp.]MDR0268157.1 radical SAM protein [Paenibacillus sp.]
MKVVVTRYVFIHKMKDRYLLLNSLTGAVDIVEERMIDAIREIRDGHPHSLSHTEVAFLMERGYLYRELSDEEAVVNRLVEWSANHAREHSPITFIFCPTMACNLRCPYCFEPHKMHENSQVMTLEQVDFAFAAMDSIREQRADLPRASFNLFGGEPLLPTSKHVVERIMLKAEDRGLVGSVTTNGTFIDEYIDILFPYRQNLIFQITIDGTKEMHDKRRITAGGKGTFDKITQNITLYLEKGFTIEIRMNLNEENVDIIPEFLTIIDQFGWNHYPNFSVALSPVTNYTGFGGDGLLPPHQIEDRIRMKVAPHLLNKFRVQLNGDFARLNLPISKVLGESLMPGEHMPSLHYCEASGGRFYVFAPDNLVYPCNQIIGDSSWAIGQYYPELSIDEQAAALWEKRNVTQMSQCSGCSIAFLCSGGCPVMAKRAYGSPMASYCGTSKQELHDYIDSVADKIMQAVEE